MESQKVDVIHLSRGCDDGNKIESRLVLARFGHSTVGNLYISIKENLLIPGGGFPRTPPKLEGLGE